MPKTAYDDDRPWYRRLGGGDDRRRTKYYDDGGGGGGYVEEDDYYYDGDGRDRGRDRYTHHEHRVRRAASAPRYHDGDSHGYGDGYYGGHDRSYSRGRRSRAYSSRSPSRSRSAFDVFGDDRDLELRQVVTSALAAGAIEAFRLRNTPGQWAGSKGGRVATAAIGAAVADTAVDKNPHTKTKRHIVEATVAGLLTDRLLNGKRNK
ncbi:hypothetical protein SPI_07205 [Niveomyces insectorum RCEF 264]|uniref:Uncharacterized protein n=1 Tax=Niveomyces insectorum RCEF 264 TaxID=1081102 RepID=A0A167QDQ2_9HYPO|nr:hypothetical protein SPI_07205 [Niveomyces insectorum RCEF 264]